MDSLKLAEMLDAIRSGEPNIHSILIIRHGVLIMEAYFDPFHAEAPHELASCTKSVTSALVGIAIDKGLMKGASQPAYELFPEVILDDERKQEITVENLLTMTSGLEWPEWEHEYRSPVNPYSATTYMPDSAQYFFDQPLIEQPGVKFNYNSGGSHMLSVMVSRAADMSTLEFARRELFTPLGISVVQWPKAEDGVNLGGSGMRLLPRDMAKFGQLYLQKGQWDGRQVISEAWVNASTQPHSSPEAGMNYGYQWWIPQDKGYLAMGWGQQNIWVLPEQDLVVVITAGMKNDLLLPHAKIIDQYILPAVKSDSSLPPDPQGEAQLAAELFSAQYPAPQLVKPLPPIASQIVGKTYLVTGSSITLGLQSFLIEKFTDTEMLIDVSLTHEDLKLRAGLDGVFRRSPTETGEIALQAYWEGEKTLVLTWQNLQSAEHALIHITFQGNDLVVTVDLYVEGISETSDGTLLN